MRRAIAIRHIMFEDLGSFAAVLEQRGYQIEYRDAGVDPVDDQEVREADLLVVLGGPIGANDERDYPVLLDSLAVLRERISADRPTIGICLGAQLIARALGAAVYPNTVKEVGWNGLTLTAAGERSSVAVFADSVTSMLHWHGDTFDLPEGATLLASTACCRNQIFQIGRTMAFQCHPEADPRALERWYIGHTAELAALGHDIVQLRAESYRLGPVLKVQAALFLQRWLDQVAH